MRMLASLLLICAPALTAQRTWIVDERGGAGHDFKDLAPAMTAAADGDTILVRPGFSYTAGTTSKGLRILGEGLPSLYFAVLKVGALPAGRTFVLAGFDLSYTKLELDGCAGRVHLERVTGSGAQLVFTNSADVTLSNVNVQGGGGPALSITGSTVALSGCQITGQHAYVAKYSSAPSELAAVLMNARVTVGATTLLGGDASQHLAASPAIQSSGGSLLLAGDAQTRVAAGLGTGGLASIVTQGGKVTHDARVQVPKITGTATVTTRITTALVATGAAPGRSVVTTQIGRSGHVSVLMAAAPAAALPTSYGELRLDLATLLSLDSAVLDASGRRIRTFPVPNDANLRGLPVALQVIGGTLSPESLWLSPVAVVVLH